MKRLFFAALLVVLLALIVGIGTYFVYQANSDMNLILDEIEQAVLKEDIDGAKKLCVQAENKWVDFEKRLTYFVNHSELCEIGVNISSMKALINKSEKAEFFSELENIRVKLTHLAAMEKINK